MKREKLDIIWNMSLVCPWDCAICCVDAYHVIRNGDSIILKSEGLNKIERYKVENGKSIYDQAARIFQSKGIELNLEQKLKVLENLQCETPVKINFSGGDPLVVSENFEVIKRASEIFGRNHIQVSTTGAGLSNYDPSELVSFINKLKFSYDGTNGKYYPKENPNRPIGYNNSNLTNANRFGKAGVYTIAEIPLTIRNTNESEISLIYENLNRAGIDEALLMRLFPVGRGFNRRLETPSPEQYIKTIDKFMGLGEKYGKPIVRLQCALKYLYSRDNSQNPCDLYRKSFAITNNGLLIASAWAIGPTGRPLDDVWVFGNIAEKHIDDILNSEKARYYEKHLNDNFGHCKIFSFFNGKKETLLGRIFEKKDPIALYTESNINIIV